jgi:murein DD-endopeptidase MepM/ murein hydrolase activator NlpD
MLRLLSIALALAALSACAHAQKMTFAEAGLLDADEPELAPPTPIAATNGGKPAVIPAGPPLDPTLLRFASLARDRRARSSKGATFPEEAVAAWEEMAFELDGFLRRPLAGTPLVEVVRARVTLETELDLDERRFGTAPEPLRGNLLGRISRLGARIAAHRSLGHSLYAKARPGVLAWPIEHAGLSSTFGMRIHPVDGLRRMHWGIDLAADKGTLVSAAGKGIVVQAGWTGGFGLFVEVRHPGDVTTRYGHLSRLLCAVGDPVDPGRPLGLVGSTGLSTGPHLHFEVWRGGEAKDPLALLGGWVGPASGSASGVGGD